MAAELRDRIRSGVLRPGDRMPTQARLAREFGVERGAVREALRILHAENLLTNVTKGAPPSVAARAQPGRAGPGTVPQPTTAALGPRIAAAFEAPHVEIDALCLTSVSLTMAMGEPLRQIHAGHLKPARIDVRVLLPSRDIGLAFPSPVERYAGGDGSGGRAPDEEPDESGERAVHRNWLAQRNAQGQVLEHNLMALRSSHGIDVRVEYRALPFTPPVKLYLLNNDEALFAYYTLTKRGAEIEHERLEMYDVQGTQAMLFAFDQQAGPRDAAYVEQSQYWFGALWNTISAELRLS